MKTRIATGGELEFGDAGQGKPVVLLHAFPLSQEMWRLQVEALRGEHRVLTPGLRGFGGSDGFSGTPSVDQMADDVAALLDALHVAEPVVLGGLSMGGYVALAFARRHPSRLRALLLADTRSEPDDAEGKANRDRLIAFVQGHTARAVIDQMLPKLVTQETLASRAEVVEEVRRIASAQPVAAIVGAVQALRDRPDAGPTLASIRVPTLVVVGDADVLTPRAMAEKLVAGIHGARLEVIRDAGHLSNLEQPEHFNRVLRSFLQSLP